MEAQTGARVELRTRAERQYFLVHFLVPFLVQKSCLNRTPRSNSHFQFQSVPHLRVAGCHQHIDHAVTLNKQTYKEILVHLRDAIRRKENNSFYMSHYCSRLFSQTLYLYCRILFTLLISPHVISSSFQNLK
ncbi:hypothetical protein LAZ67_12001703 [Cordylochernes scorpioides]|uniref:Uncharacterized protein n=1 Tax=Cordylochernes scorpioides TaxID=51811 RepID=A0ABY6L4S3_9ARAC|nr:hypothetical protein LAZ67_12001703 [Cordylochernes scorpioides]